jgi:hypothetical protein
MVAHLGCRGRVHALIALLASFLQQGHLNAMHALKAQSLLPV